MGPISSPDGTRIGPILVPSGQAHKGPVFSPVALSIWVPNGQPRWGPDGCPDGTHMGPIFSANWEGSVNFHNVTGF